MTVSAAKSNGIDVALPNTPELSLDQGVFNELMLVYRAIKNLQAVVGTPKDKARIYLTAAFSTPSTAASSTIPLDTVSFDTNSISDVVTNHRITPKKAGYYSVAGRFSVLAGLNTRVSCILNKNGGFSSYGGDTAAYTAGETIGLTLGDVIYCNGTTDYLELVIFTAASCTFESGAGLTYLSVSGPL